MIDYYSEGKSNSTKRKVNKKKVIIVTCILIVLLILGSIFALYVSNENVREFLDIYILRKKIEENNANLIEIEGETNSNIYAYDKYVSVLNRNTLTLYNSSGKSEQELKIQINNPIYDANGHFLVIAERNGQKVYLLSGQTILWEKEMEGDIARVRVNKNGYVSIILAGTTHKTVVVCFTAEGKPLPKTYLSKTKALDSSISNDNKYLAYAEVNTSGSLIQSNIKIISLEKAQTDSENAVISTYSAEENKLILDIKYTEKNRLVCMYDDGISYLQNGTEEELFSMKDNKIIMADIDLDGYAVRIEEVKDGLFKSSANVIMMNTSNKKENLYKIEGVPKTIYAHQNTVAIHLGTEIHFVSINGWLTKKYISSQEVKDVAIGNSIAGVVYRDKIEVFGI